MTSLKSPYPYTGGKRPIADRVWERLGADVPNFIDPFCGSNAMLLGRPGGSVLLQRPGGPGKIETINDLDGGIVNFWRAISFGDEQEVARWCDWPVSELDLHARHDWLIQRLTELAPKLRSDPHFFDSKIAGWWCWGICLWLGPGWCSTPKKQKPRAAGTEAVGALSYVNQKSEARKPSIGNDRGIHGVSAPPCSDWFGHLKQRTRNVRILCGDWSRVLTPSVLGFGKNVGGRKPTAVFLDPTYSPHMRTPQLYAHDEEGLSLKVREWAIAHGDNPHLRIALCGYEGEHEMPDTWDVLSWTGQRGHASASNKNRELERIWFSQNCLRPCRQTNLLDLAGIKKGP